LPSPPATPKNISEYDRRCSLPQSSIWTVSNLLESSSSCNISYEQKHGPIYTSTPASAGGIISSSSQTSIEYMASGGIERSSGFHEQVFFYKLSFESNIAFNIR
jgi:hypothetical protein